MASLDMDDLYEDFTSSPVTVTPAKLRSKLTKLLASTDIKIGELQKMLGVNANSWGKFMPAQQNVIERNDGPDKSNKKPTGKTGRLESSSVDSRDA